MDDAELTRLAIEEIVRGMEELKEPQVHERKVNPIAKPNKRFLGRTLNSMISHNKRTNDRTQANCRRKLKELDERKKLTRTTTSRSRGGSWELVLSSSSDDDHSKDARERKKSCSETTRKKYKKSKKKSKSKKHKSNRRDSSSSSGSSSESSSSTSSSYKRSKKFKSRKNPKHKKCKEDVETNVEEAPQMYYQSEINDAIQLDAVLIANSYRQHQMQQLFYYSALIAGQECAEIEALKEELRTSDAEASDTKTEKISVSSVVSSLNSNDSESGESGVLQISLSSASSTSSKATGNKILTKNGKNEDDKQEEVDSSDSSNDVVWNLDSDSSNDNRCTEKNSKKKEKQQNNDECICLTSESESKSDSDNESDIITCESDVEKEKLTSVANEIRQPLTETVTLLSSSDSEVEIVSMNGDDEIAENKLDTASKNSTPTNTEQLQEVIFECEESSNSEVSGQKDSPSISPRIRKSVSVEKEAAEGLETQKNGNINTSLLVSSSNVERTKQLEEVILQSEKNDSLETESKALVALENVPSTNFKVIQTAIASNIEFSLSESHSNETNNDMEQVKCHVLDDIKNTSHTLPTEEYAANAESTMNGITSASSVVDFSKPDLDTKLSLTEIEVNNKVVNETGEEEVDETVKSLLTSPPLDVASSPPLSASLPSAPPPLLTTVGPVVTELPSVSTDNSNQSEANQ